MPPKTGYFECCEGTRLGIEEVYRIPLDKVNDISYGKKRVVIETYEESCSLNNLNIEVKGFERDCSYVYYYDDVENLSEYRDDDGYCYIHVWGREKLGSGEGLSFYLFAVLSIFFILPIVLLYIVLRSLAYRIINKMQKNKQP